MICSETVTISAIRSITEPGTSSSVKRSIACSARMISAGPEVNADARKRGPRIAVCQKGRATLDEKRNAVTVWIEIAQKIDSTTAGK